MKTIAINNYGPASNFQLLELPQPHPTDQQVLVAVHAFSVNPMDVAGRAGRLGAPFTNQWTFPLVLGWDFAGTIVSVGDAVTDFKVGDAVFGAVPLTHPGTTGTYAEYVVTTTEQLAPLPTGLSFDLAATLPVAGMTAYDALVHRLNLQSGERLLIQGGAGGVGLFAVQLAKFLGAYVATTASANHQTINRPGCRSSHRLSPHRSRGRVPRL